MRKLNSIRAGVTSVLAMMYLVLFASLAVGFYSTTNSSVQVSRNELLQDRSRSAAETGVYFAHYQLSQITMPAATPLDQRFITCGNLLATQLNGTANLKGGTIYTSASLIRIPSDPTSYIDAGDGSQFRLLITSLGQGAVRVQSIGKNTAVSANAPLRAVQLDFDLAMNHSPVFDYGVATRGTIATSGNSKIMSNVDPKLGSILVASASATPINIGGDTISGDIYVSNPLAVVTVKSGSSVGGTTDPVNIMTNHVHTGVAVPEWPVVDTSAYAAYATNAYVSGQPTYSNVRIPPNVNPSFPAGTTVKGVMYIETPNKVTFSGSCIIQGVVVVKTDNQVGNLLTNTITFSGGVTASGVDTLDASYGSLRSLTGAFLLAPGFAVTMSGGFGQVGGAIVCDKLSMSGSASGTLNGSVLIMKDQPMSLTGGAALTVNNTGFSSVPQAIRVSSRYSPRASSYDEIKVP